MKIKEKLIIKLVQMSIHWHHAEANCSQIEQRLKQPTPKNNSPSLDSNDNASKEHRETAVNADIIILPEMFNSGFSMQPDKVAETMDGYTVNWMHSMAKKFNAVIVGSVAIKEQGDCFNRMLWVTPDGSVVHYDKKHLFAMAGENKRYRAGDKRVVVNYQGWNILLQVCYDLRFPVWCRQQSLDYDLMILVANWPNARANAWNGLIPARAIENQAYVAAVNRVGEDARGLVYAGDSQLIDYLGKQLLHADDEEVVLTWELDYNELQRSRIQLPFHKDADRIKIE